MTIEDIVNQFNTTPFLFMGSGITRRYLSLPDWKSLLEHFANIVNADEFSYSSYENKAVKMNCKAGLMPKIAELIQKDFEIKWFSDPSIRTLDEHNLEKVKNGLSPFKAEVASYIKNCSVINPIYRKEIELLKKYLRKAFLE